METWGLGTEGTWEARGVGKPEKQQRSQSCSSPPPIPPPGLAGQRLRTAATGTTEDILSAWSCANALSASSYFISVGRDNRRPILQTRKRVRKGHGRLKVEPVCPPKPKAKEFNCSSCFPAHNQPLTTHSCSGLDRTTSPLPHGGETESQKEECYTNTWV